MQSHRGSSEVTLAASKTHHFMEPVLRGLGAWHPSSGHKVVNFEQGVSALAQAAVADSRLAARFEQSVEQSQVKDAVDLGGLGHAGFDAVG